MRYLEQQNILHRDVSMRNLLVRAQDDDPFFVKVSDFGLSAFASKGKFAVSQHTTKWSAPEAITERKYAKGDIWSFGVLLWEIFSRGEEPYSQWSPKEALDNV